MTNQFHGKNLFQLHPNRKEKSLNLQLKVVITKCLYLKRYKSES